MKGSIGRLQLQREVVLVAHDAFIMLTVRGDRCNKALNVIACCRVDDRRPDCLRRVRLPICAQIGSNESTATACHVAIPAFGGSKEKCLTTFRISRQSCRCILPLKTTD